MCVHIMFAYIAQTCCSVYELRRVTKINVNTLKSRLEIDIYAHVVAIQWDGGSQVLIQSGGDNKIE